MKMATCFYSSPIGKLKISATSSGVCEIGFSRDFNKSQEATCNLHLKTCVRQLDEYFSRKRESFDFALDMQGTEFQKKVWLALQKIPYGATLSYGEIAHQIGNPKAMRAVGLANNKNKIAIVIPCHRVIGKDGSLTGYAGGVGKKQWLLNHEQIG